MNDVVKKLRERRLQVWNESRTITDRALAEKRAFTAEEQQSYDRMTAEINALDARAKDLIDGEKRAKEQEEAFRSLSGGEQAEQRGGGENAELRAWARGETSSRSFIVKPEQRDLGSGSLGTGGAVKPTTFYGRLMEHLIDTSGLLQAGPTVITTDDGDSIDFPTTVDHGVATITPEATPLSEDDPEFSKLTLGAYKYGKVIHVPSELIKDSGVDLEAYLAKQAGVACGNALGAHLITGDGSDKPRGITADTTAGATGPTGVSGGFGSQSTAGRGYDLLIALFHSVISPYRRSKSCAWLMNDTTAGVLRMVKNSDGVYALQPGITLDSPDTLLGKPIRYDPFVPDIALNAKSIVFGDISTYIVRFAGGFEFRRSDDFRFDEDVVSFRAIIRGDGGLSDLTGSAKHFVGGNS